MIPLKRKQLPWYAIGGFGLNLLNTIASIYLADALMLEGFKENAANWTFAEKTIIFVLLFSVLKAIAQVVDGIIDIPFAHLTDNLKSKFGKRRPVMLVGGILTLGLFVAMCFPLSTELGQIVNGSVVTPTTPGIINAIWFGVLYLLFYCAYTMTYVTYYGTYSEVCENEKDRIWLSDWKAFIDTVQYALAYALIPLMVGGLNIKWISLIMAPLGLTFLICVFLPKERSSLPADVAKWKAEHPDDIESKVADETPILKSIKFTFKNKNFVMWLLVLGFFFFGLQMFLSGQNVLASGPMGLNSWQIAIINTSAFAPVPLMLILYKKVMKKKGFRFAFITALASFMLCMITFSVAYVGWIPNQYLRLAIGATGGTIGSYGIGAFFMAPYMIPAQNAAEDKVKNRISNPSMYFAVQGLVTAGVGALSTGLLWPNLRTNFGNKEVNELLGAHIMPYIVAGFCLIAIVMCLFLPKSYDQLGRGNKVENKDGDAIKDSNAVEAEVKAEEPIDAKVEEAPTAVEEKSEEKPVEKEAKPKAKASTAKKPAAKKTTKK